jgi:hypothetical protein
MKPRHKIPSPKEAGLVQSISFLTRIKNSFSKNHEHTHPHAHMPEANLHSGHNHNSEPADVKINTIAIVLDGQVYDVLRAQDTLADLLLAQPTFVLVTEKTSVARVNYKYVDGKFIENEPTT